MTFMQPISNDNIEDSNDFVYEVKYDGFRAQLIWEQHSIQLISRNGKDLTIQFPEIIAYCRALQAENLKSLPVILDGELVILNNDYQANFSLLQTRGRLKNVTTIRETAKKRPASFLAFDLLQFKGKSCLDKIYIERKELLQDLFKQDFSKSQRLCVVKTFDHLNEAWDIVFTHQGEGVVAKRKTSKYEQGKAHHDWYKKKNWRTIDVFLTNYQPENDYFTAAVYDHDGISEIGKCKHGLDRESKQALTTLFTQQGKKTKHGLQLPPALCASIYTLDPVAGELREPEFAQLLPHISPDTCTREKMLFDLSLFPKDVQLSHTDKLFWPKYGYTKGHLLTYLRNVSPYMLPYLKARALTIIRSPDGIEKPSFYQKSLPDYAPNYLDFVYVDDKNVMICNELNALIWLANHGTVEYHLPFHHVNKSVPCEIVIDLDPPNRNKFYLAIEAAMLIKQLLDDLKLISFVKTSGNKGLQIHIPLPIGKLTYNQATLLTEVIAKTIENEAPTLFTTERLKKNRKGRLYIDYVQYGKGKTIIAPYSPRLTNEATVAMPLFWEEVNDQLTVEAFTIINTVNRVQTNGCPFNHYFSIGAKQKMTKVANLLNI